MKFGILKVLTKRERERERESYAQKFPWYVDFKKIGFMFDSINFSSDPYTGRYADECVYFNQTAQSLYNSVHHVVGSAVPGDIAEFGTFSGASAITLAGALRRNELRFLGQDGIDRHHGILARHIHFFDSFKGMPKSAHTIDTTSPHILSGVWREGTMKGISPFELKKYISFFLNEERIHIYEGYFENTLSMIPEGTKFSLVHIDSDLYKSAYDVLDYLFSHNMLSDGCNILFDDWLCNRGNPSMGEQKAWSEIVSKYNPTYTDLGGYSAMCHKFIIHKEQ